MTAALGSLNRACDPCQSVSPPGGRRGRIEGGKGKQAQIDTDGSE